MTQHAEFHPGTPRTTRATPTPGDPALVSEFLKGAWLAR